MVDPSLATGMAEFVTMQVLHYHRRMPEVAANQRARLWQPLRPPVAADRTVGILGFGQLGAYCAECLVRLGFDMAVWSRSPKNAPGMTCFAGQAELSAFLARSEIVVCLLPLTPDTVGILDAAAFAAMPRGGFVINVGRGRHVVEPDLLAALDSGQIAGATLDVFAVEPLPEAHPFWAHERVTVVPHISALTQPRTAVPVIADNIRRHRAGLPLLHAVDRARGY
jgi:glyoxylate/hydroxypyruvate reductase A